MALRRLRIEIAVLLTLLVVGLGFRVTTARAQAGDLAAAVNFQHWAATGDWLAGDHALDIYAQALAERMANAGFLAHSDVGILLGCQWGVVAENIGTGRSVDRIVAAFMASPSHAENITDDFTHLGVGLAIRDGTLWVATIFAR